MSACADPESFVREGPSSARQQNAIGMAFRWRADVGLTSNAGLVFQGIRSSITKKPYIFVVFQGDGGIGTWSVCASEQLEIHSPENTNKIPEVRTLTCTIHFILYLTFTASLYDGKIRLF